VPGCPRWAAPVLCRGHGTRVGEWLADIYGLYAALDAVPGGGVTDGRTAGLASHKAPARLDVLVLRDGRSGDPVEGDPDGNRGVSVLALLRRWADTIRDERGLEPPRKLNVDSERRLLAAHLDWALTRPWAGGLYGDVRRVWSALKAAHGEPPPKPAATCWVPLEDFTLCGGPVWVDTGAAWCGLCGTTWTGMDLLRIAPALDGAA
jgi:hypothetical protein